MAGAVAPSRASRALARSYEVARLFANALGWAAECLAHALIRLKNTAKSEWFNSHVVPGTGCRANARSETFGSMKRLWPDTG